MCLSSKLDLVPRLHHTAKYLSLHDNNIQQYSDVMLYSGLLYLDMSLNKISELLYGGFAHLKYLKTLLLNKNNILRIESNAFSGLDNLEYLDLSENKFGLEFEEFGLPRPSQELISKFDFKYDVSQCLFKGLQRLVHLGLSSTKLTKGYKQPFLWYTFSRNTGSE